MEFGGGVSKYSDEWRYQDWWRRYRYAIVDYLVDEFKNQSGVDLRNDKMAMARLKEPGKGEIELSISLQPR